MISEKEFLKNYKKEDLPEEHQRNTIDLLGKINVIRELYGHMMIVSSGYRSMEDHLRIYKEKGITDVNKIPMKSKHLSAQAIDIADPHRLLKEWVILNEKILIEVGLWCEDLSYTIGWVHFQTVPPKSGKRFFIP